MRKLIFVFLLLLNAQVFSQHMHISGTLVDTITNTSLEHSVAMAVRIKDSVMLGFARADKEGRFEMKSLPIDTVQVIISNPRFSEQYFYVFGSSANSVFDFGKIVLPPKSQQLKEVIIYAFKDPVYYKGDTLVYTADSFKVKPNATVEDLLRKLPGIKVDASGKITSQGKEISQVLVDGDEFFGSDPTVATRNLAAQGVESVQVYEKKDENATEGGTETVQIMNLKLKDEAKKGYFGKVSGASDFQKFYEGELLANKFNKQQKISVFALGSNTPRSSLGWQDMYKYGLNNEMNSFDDGDGNTYFYNNNSNNGIPRTLKSGIYYADKFGKNTKVNFNYSYSNNNLNTKSENRTQYFLADTSYVTEEFSTSNQETGIHSFNLGIEQKIDSLTDLEIRPKLTFNANKTKNYNSNRFFTSTDSLTRENEVENTNKANGFDAGVRAKLTRRFKLKDRQLLLSYNGNAQNDQSDGILKSFNTYYSGLLFFNDTLNQRKDNVSEKQNHNSKLVFTEPFGKKIKLEFEYIFNYSKNHQSKKALNYFNGEYALSDSLFSNDFENIQLYNRVGLKFIYETKKIRFAIGSRVQQNELQNTNLITNAKIKYSGTAVLPFLSYMYRFSDNTRLNFSYYSNVNQPNVNQLQPVPDNTNPNRVVLGNPNLNPSFTHRMEMWFNSWKPISGRHMWSSLSFNMQDDAFANSSTFDSIGRTVSQTVNVDGNYNGNFYIGGGIPFFQKLISLEPNINGGINSYSNFVNGRKNRTETASLSAGLNIVIQSDTIEFQIGADYTWNQTQSSLNTASNKPYTDQVYNAAFRLRLPFKFLLETEVDYNVYSQRSQGFNTNFVIWNAALRKTILKNENLILSFEANDILNQNINNVRTIQNNTITDTKTNIINRYFLLRLVYKFNSTKTKENDDEW
ncbi:MAG: outer membrane beta-barrel protein [Bacteroidia bacterium]|nr:outer membrane beta-barrel protein [Bacteroidia bacterium]